MYLTMNDSPVAASRPVVTSEQPPTAANSDRRLAPPDDERAVVSSRSASGQDRPAEGFQRIVDFGLPMNSIHTVGCALAIVIGAFLLFVWLLRRGGRTTEKSLPSDVVSVLGRTPLADRQFAQLIRVGNKLVLVQLTPTAVQTITEVTDPAEVDRIMGLCQQADPHSTTKAFEQVFQQLTREPAPRGFLGNESPPSLPPSLAPSLGPSLDMFRASRGDAARA